MNDKFQELFEQYDFSLTDAKVKAAVDKIVSDNFDRNNEKAVYSKILSFIDVTSLNSTDSADSIVEFTEKVNNFDDNFEILPHPAAICVYPSMVPVVRDTLSEDIEIAAVAGFPHSQTFLEVKIAEVAMAVMEGATEIDVVFPLGKFLSGNYEEVYDEIKEIKDACRSAKLKVILETGLLKTFEAIKKASVISMAAGADFIKTSTGKVGQGASLEAAYVMCSAIKEFNSKNRVEVGFKAAGGISETSDAVKYYSVVESVLGERWLSPELFRIGASRLVNNLLSSLVGNEIKYF